MVGWERFDPVGVAEIPERMILQTYDLSEVNVFGPFDKMIFDEFCIIVLGRGVLLQWLWLCHAPFDPK